MPEPPPPARPRLLVVDDQPANVQVLYEALAPDYQVFLATGGEQAIRLAQDKLPDLILLDVVMPGLDGHEVCRRLKSGTLTANIPIIFVTCFSREVDETRGLDVGAVDFIAKPINPRVLRARVRTQLTIKRQADLLRQMAFTDSLTGLHNRRYFDDRLRQEWLRAVRNSSALSLLLIDIDHFKQFNDRHGHQAGDACLRRVAQALAAGLNRPADLLARYGGEEFACLLPETEPAGAQILAERLERLVFNLGMEHDDPAPATPVTVSIGVAGRSARPAGDRSMDDQALIGQADQQLYRAKHAGRARVCAQEVTTFYPVAQLATP